MRRTLILLALGLGAALAQGYTDLKPSDPEWQAVQVLSEMGVVFGYPDGTFRPKQAITRKEVALALYRLWLKAREANDQALAEAARKLAQSIADLAQTQGELRDKLAKVEELARTAMSPEEAEGLKAEVAALRSTLSTVEETVSNLASQYASLLEEQARLKEGLAAVDQRSLAWNEDAASLQSQVRKLQQDLAEAQKAMEGLREELKRSALQLDAALRQAIQEEVGKARDSLEALRQDLLDRVAQAAKQIGDLGQRLAGLEERLTATREEVFRLSEDLAKTKAELTARLNRLEKTPPPFYLSATLSGFQPILAAFALGHDSVGGIGVQARVEWNQGTGDTRVGGLLYVPFFREPARGQVGFGLAYALAGPASGDASVLLGVGLGLGLSEGFEAYGEGRFFFPTDGATPFARIGLGVRFRP